MLNRKTLCILLLLIVMVLPGCWSKKELNELAVVMALGVDLHPEGFLVSAQVMDSSQVGSKQKSPSGSLPIITYQSAGKTIPDALQRMLSMAPRMLYLSHLRVMVFGESLARRGVSDALDYISRDHELRNDFFLLVAKGSDAADILQVVTPFENIPASSLFSSILISHKKWAATGKVTLQKFITELERSGSNPILSGVKRQGALSEEAKSVKNVQTVAPNTMLEHAGIAVFKRDRLVGWLEEPSGKTVNYVLNDVASTIGNLSCSEGGTIGFTVYGVNSSIDVRLDADGKPEFKVNLALEANLNAVQCTIDLNQPSTIETITTRLEDEYNRNLTRNIRDIQHQYGSDIFGFGEALHRKYPSLWKEYRQHWEDSFKTVKIGVRSKVAIRRIGSVVQPVKRRMDTR
ncbi:Ger(x)C family spore germination protein [Paenibacillus albidus]|uniref:Ger(x)C family spore germination protein n=1 Tax=Paenibacillus albidus TaxID=2041023 RepID=UPI001BEA0305|nr:Ger(x)C family spore germination protein [Paenibacillus albidus]MBT2289700.1 Ger(x)C family spore germination protein [Paenibacillus albidus]